MNQAVTKLGLSDGTKRALRRGGLAGVILAGMFGATQASADNVILDDLIVDGSACIGQDCVNGESFGFDTLRLKENNLRIKFDDTSVSASFPNNDWQLTANDSSNGGQNKFSIDDITGGRTPFTVEAGAPSHSLYVDSSGRVGLGTSNPVVELVVVDGDSPTIRLEQNGSSGFTPQTFDIAANETNFFIRDVTNGSKLPFRIEPGEPGAPDNVVYLDSTGKVGFGDTGPNARLTGNQGAADDLGLSLKSSDVGHGFTTANSADTQTDDYYTVSKRDGEFGGARIQGVAENAATSVVLQHISVGGQADTAKTSSARGLVEYLVQQHNGSNALADVAATGNAMVVRVRSGGSNMAKFIVSEDGSIWSDMAATVFDTHDDAALARAFDQVFGEPANIIRSQFDDWINYDRKALEAAQIIGKSKDGSQPMWNVTQHVKLLNGAVWQQRMQLQVLAEALEAIQPGAMQNVNARLRDLAVPQLHDTTREQ